MAGNTITGSFSGGQWSSYFTLKLKWSSVADVVNNRSTVTLGWYLVVAHSNSGFVTNKQGAGWTQNVGGASTSGSIDFNTSAAKLAENTDILLHTETAVVNHNDDGTKTVSVSGTFDLSGTTAGTGSLSGNLVLDNIDRTPATPTVSVTDGNSGTVYNGEMVEVTISGASGYVTGYNWQRSVNGGAWSASQSTTDTVFYDTIPEGTTSLKYRVQAINPARSSDWATSNTLNVASNTFASEVTSGSLATNKYNSQIGLILSWSASQSVADNSSEISWTLKSSGGSTTAWWNSAPIKLIINGTTVLNITERFKLYGGGAWSKSGKITIAHNNDGTKSFSASISAAIYTSAVNCKASGTWTLKKIARNPSAPTSFTISAGYGNYVGLGDTIDLKWLGASGNITEYELQYSRGNSGWKAWKTVTGTSTTDSFTATDIAVNGAGCAVKYRVRAMNGSLPSDWKESNTLYITGGMDLKVSNAWKTGSVWINVNGTWKRAKRVYVKVNGSWQYSK